MDEFKVTNTDGKVEFLARERKVDIYEIKAILDAGDWLDILKHPKKKDQWIYVVQLGNYCYTVPVVRADNTIKTVFPSRKMTKKYLNEDERNGKK